MDTHTEPSTSNQPLNTILVQKNNWSLSFLFLVLGILLGSVGVLAFQTYSPKQADIVLSPNPTPTTIPSSSLTPTSQITSIPNPTPTLDPSVTWKTVTEQSLGYSIKYPTLPGFGRMICQDETKALYFTNGVVSDPVSIASCPRDSRYSIEIVTNNKPFTDYQDSYNITSTDTIVDSIKAVKKTHTLKGEPEGPTPTWYITIRFERNGVYYEAYTGNKNLETYLDQMMTTFKFL